MPALRIEAERKSTAQTLLASIFEIMDGKPSDFVIFEYNKQEARGQGGNPINSRHYTNSAEAIKLILKELEKQSGNKPYYTNYCHALEETIKIPNLPIPFKDNKLDFESFKISPASIDVINKRKLKLERRMERKRTSLSKIIGDELPTKAFDCGTFCRLDVIKQALYLIESKGAESHQYLVKMLYYMIAARERERLLYKERPNVKWKLPQDDMILSSIDEMVGIIGDYPFEAIATGTSSTFKLESKNNGSIWDE